MVLIKLPGRKTSYFLREFIDPLQTAAGYQGITTVATGAAVCLLIAFHNWQKSYPTPTCK
jgi:hypothetical protein